MSAHDTLGHLELLTVEQAADALHKSPQGVRRLIHRGKLSVLPDETPYLIKAESVAAYLKALPHPPHLMAAMYYARQVIALRRRRDRYTPSREWMRYATAERVALEVHLMDPALPLCRALLDALQRHDYACADGVCLDLNRVITDYHMLHAPLKAEPRPVAEQGRLFKVGQA